MSLARGLAKGLAGGFGLAGRGGGGDPTALTPANADARFTAAGLTQAGTGTTKGETNSLAVPLYDVAAGKVPLGYNATLGVWGPIVNPSGTDLLLYEADLTNAAWVKSDDDDVALVTGSLSDAGAANGHSRITASVNDWTAIQTVTSSSAGRRTHAWVSRVSGTGDVQLTQDGGSAWTTISLSANPQRFVIDAQTLANPQIGIRVRTSGDVVDWWGATHQVGARTLRPEIGPTSGSTVTSGGRSLTRTLGVAPTEIDIEIASLVPPSTASFLRTLWIGKASDSANKRIDINYNSGILRVNLTGVTPFSQAVSAETPFKMRIWQSTTGGYSVTFNDGTPITGAGNLPTDIDALEIGTFSGGIVPGAEPILAFRDNLQNLLVAAPYGWNHDLLDSWS